MQTLNVVSSCGKVKIVLKSCLCLLVCLFFFFCSVFFLFLLLRSYHFNCKLFLFFLFHRVANRVHASDGFLFIFLMIYYTAFVCIIYEVTKNLNIVLTRGMRFPIYISLSLFVFFLFTCINDPYNIYMCFNNLFFPFFLYDASKECVRNPFTIIITGTSSIVIVGVLTLHIIYAARDRELAEFLGFLFIGSLLHFCIFLAPGEAHGHIHHWLVSSRTLFPYLSRNLFFIPVSMPVSVLL